MSLFLRLQDCGEELLADLSEVVFNELAFFRLMQNIDSIGAKSKTSVNKERNGQVNLYLR